MSTHAKPRREEQLEAVHNRLTAAVESLVTGKDWQRAIEFAARFRSRCFNNCLLIAQAHTEAYELGRVPVPSPTYVAGFKQWQSLGRSVLKGQPGYQILAPRTARFATDRPGPDAAWRQLARNEKPKAGESVKSRMIGIRVTHVWDISQTEGAEIPTLPRPQLLRGKAPPGLWDRLADLITAEGYGLRLVSNATAIGGFNGLTDFGTREVSMRTDMDDAAQVKTLCHELGHVLLSDPDSADAPLHRGIAEVEAESVALMVSAAHQMDTSTYTIPYVATWASTIPDSDPVEVVQATAQRVRRATVGILERLDTPQIETGTPPGLERTTSAPGPAVQDRPVAYLRPDEAIGL